MKRLCGHQWEHPFLFDSELEEMTRERLSREEEDHLCQECLVKEANYEYLSSEGQL
jgi:hypothetical protein